MMTPESPRREPWPLLLVNALTYTERHILWASLMSARTKQAAVHPYDSPIYRDTSDLMTDFNQAEENAAAYREHTSATCRTCGASGAVVELEKITARPVGGGSARTEWLCADSAACTARRFPALAEVLDATGNAA